MPKAFVSAAFVPAPAPAAKAQASRTTEGDSHADLICMA